jgi:hypothetical protein
VEEVEAQGRDSFQSTDVQDLGKGSGAPCSRGEDKGPGPSDTGRSEGHWDDSLDVESGNVDFGDMYSVRAPVERMGRRARGQNKLDDHAQVDHQPVQNYWESPS